MHRLLIPLFCFILSYQSANAQDPVAIKNNGPAPLPTFGMQRSPLICGSAGNFNFGTFIGQSNDISLPELFFCKGDSIFLDHIGDFDLSGDPIPGTPPGIGYAFYDCPPTIAGDNQAAVLGDPCIQLDGSGDILVGKGLANGDTWFFNSGALQTAFNGGAPVRFYFAPITIDDFATGFYENGGPCVNVNLAETFSVVYLNEVQISSLSTGVNNCQGSFKVSGGLPEFDPTARFSVDIALVSNPSIKGTVLSVPSQIVHNAFVNFSVPQTGVYTITVMDGKSCEAVATVNMTVCDITDAVLVEAPDVLTSPGEVICIDIVSPNFPNDVLGTNFSVSWNPSVVQFNSITSDLPGFLTINNTNLSNTNSGQLGFLYNSIDLINPITLPPGNVMFTLCFTATGVIGQSTGIGFAASPTPINFDDIIGNSIAPIFNFGSITIAAPQPLDFTTTISDTLCNGTAKLNIKAVGGTSPYLVQWQKTLPIPGGINSGNIANNGGTYMQAGLSSGTYSVTITDNDGFGTSIVKTVTINLPSLGVQLNLTDEPTCNGDLDGKAVAIVQLNGTTVPNPGPNYSFQWSIPLPSTPVQGAAMQTGGAGLYGVTLTDNTTGCTAQASGTMSHPAVLQKDGNPSILPTTCPGINNGQINYLMQGGTSQTGGDYEYQWNYSPTSGMPSTPFQGPTNANPNVLMALANGTYYLTVTDANGCNWQDSVEISSLKELDITLIDNVTPNCFGGSNGSLTVNASTNPAQITNFTFTWSPNPFGSSVLNGTTQSIFSGLPAGAYFVTATESGTNCVISDVFTVVQPDSLKISVLNIVNPTCDMPNNGSISVITQGGTPQYTYQWSPSPPAPSTSTAFAGNLTAGTYIVTATDNEGCSNSKTILLTLPDAPTVTFDSTSVNCGGDGCLTANAVPAVGSTVTAYQWVDLATSSVIGNNAQVCQLSGGNYQIIITDSKSCQTIDTVTLFRPNIMEIDTVIENTPSCFGLSDGSIGIVMSGGLAPYTYIWSVPSAGLPVLPLISAGLYAVTIKDQNNCALNQSIILENPAPIVNTFTNVVPTSCASTCDGIASAMPVYGTVPPTAGIFTYQWGNGSTLQNPMNLCAGYNVVTIRDVNNCFIQDSVEILKPADILLDNFNSNPTNCFGSTDGSITVNASGGNGGPFTYDWGIAVGNTVDNLAAGNYTVTATDNQGCTQEFVLSVLEPDIITIAYDTLLSSQIRCFNAADAILVVQTQGGTPGYTYAWSAGDSNNNIQGGLSAGIYFVTVTDINGCSNTSLPITLVNPPPVTGSSNPFEPIICEGDETIFTVDTIFGGSGGPFSFTVDYGINLPPDLPVALGSGIHYISYQDQYGCAYEDSIFVTPGINLQVTFPEPVVEIELGDTLYQLLPTISGGLYDTFTWTNGHLLSDSTIIDPYAETFSSTTYKLIVIDTANGCMGMGSVRIEIDPNRNVYIPNIFNPSSTLGENTHFFPKVGNGVRSINYMQVFDRWGELVYEQKNFLPNSFELEEGWNGTYRGSKASPGVFVYIIEVTFMDNRVLLYRGDVTLIR